MLAFIDPAAVPALRIAGTFFLIINILAGLYVFRNRRRFFGRDPEVEEDIPTARKLRVELILIPWFFLTAYLVVVLIELWTR